MSINWHLVRYPILHPIHLIPLSACQDFNDGCKEWVKFDFVKKQLCSKDDSYRACAKSCDNCAKLKADMMEGKLFF